MSRLEIVVWGDSDPCVEELIFYDSISSVTRQLVRGRVNPIGGGASFQFTSAVQAFIVLALRQAAFPEATVVLAGNGPSPALSLEYAILRKPSWIQDLFGVDATGSSLVFRYFNRVNAGFKRAAPIKVTINPALLAPTAISCSANGLRIQTKDELVSLADYFEARWYERGEAVKPTALGIIAL